MPKPKVPQWFAQQNSAVIRCEQCPRLRQYCLKVAQEKRSAFRNDEYHALPVQNFGDPNARVLIVGLAPAAHGANRTGRMFTGDRSGEWLYRALYKSGFANQPSSLYRNDGLTLKNCYITASCRCAPPANKPTPRELQHCRPFLLAEIQLLKNIKVMLGLGKIGFETAIACAKEADIDYRGQQVLLDGDVVDELLHSDEIDAWVAQLSAIVPIRHVVNDLIRKIAQGKHVVVEGRDITTVVFPDAEYRFFLDASPESRARRRYLQGVSKLSLEEIADGIRKRDEIDRNKVEGSLKIADGVVYLDTSDLTIEQVYDRLIEKIQL